MAVCGPGSGLFHGTVGALMFWTHKTCTHCFALLANSNFWECSAVVSYRSGPLMVNALSQGELCSVTSQADSCKRNLAVIRMFYCSLGLIPWGEGLSWQEDIP